MNGKCWNCVVGSVLYVLSELRNVKPEEVLFAGVSTKLNVAKNKYALNLLLWLIRYLNIQNAKYYDFYDTLENQKIP